MKSLKSEVAAIAVSPHGRKILLKNLMRVKEILIALVTLDSESSFLSYSNSTIVCDHVNCPSYFCLTLRQCAFGLVHLRLVSFCPSLLFLRSLVFMHPLLSTFVNCFSSLHCVFLLPFFIIPILKLSSLALPACWQRVFFFCIGSGTIHLFLVVTGPQSHNWTSVPLILASRTK